MGSQQALDNGNILITESLRGRIFEITRSGRVVWEYLNPAEVDGYHASVMEAQRLPAGNRAIPRRRLTQVGEGGMSDSVSRAACRPGGTGRCCPRARGRAAPGS